MGYSIVQSKKYENEIKVPNAPETSVVPDTDFIEIPNTTEDNITDEEITDDNIITDENNGETGNEIVNDVPVS